MKSLIGLFDWFHTLIWMYLFIYNGIITTLIIKVIYAWVQPGG